jgi:DNA-binding transcriptional LysR family regulator
MQDFNAILIFQTVVEQGSFSRAGVKLGITTSAVSRRISGLEQHLGVRLLKRSTRSLSLTESGQRYLEYAIQAQQAVVDAENAARERKDIASGILRLNAPVNLGRGRLAELIPEFIKKNPLVSFHISLNDVFTRVNHDDYDLILTTAPIPSGSFNSVKLFSITGTIVCSPAYLKEHGEPASPEALQTHNCLLPSFYEIYDDWVFQKDDTEIKIKVTGNYFCNNPIAVQIAAREGIGIACLPFYLVSEDIRKGKLLRLFEDYHMPERALRIYYSEKHFVPAKVRVFVEFLLKHLGSEV